MEFQFAHKTFIFPKEAILCYKWLACMFGLSSIGTPKTKLSHNLLEYLENVEMYKVRELVEALEYLELYYSSEEKVISDITIFGKNPKIWTYSINPVKQALKQIEHFLSYGPGTTKGLDVMYECTKCGKTSWTQEPPITTFEHKLEHLSSTCKVCIRCGYLFSSIRDNLGTTVLCVGMKNTCNHTWN
jgi:DNA-directed RNA polymerase subunit RPC12/RpoP